jgi:hypothetical protein
MTRRAIRGDDREAVRVYHEVAGYTLEEAQQIHDNTLRQRAAAAKGNQQGDDEDDDDNEGGDTAVPVAPRVVGPDDLDPRVREAVVKGVQGADRTARLVEKNNEVEIRSIVRDDKVVGDFYKVMTPDQQTYLLNEVARRGLGASLKLDLLTPNQLEDVRQRVRQYLVNTYGKAEALAAINDQSRPAAPSQAAMIGPETSVTGGSPYTEQELDEVDHEEFIPDDGTPESKEKKRKQMAKVSQLLDKGKIGRALPLGRQTG